MKIILILICSFLSFYCDAETFDSVSYYLPHFAKDWVVANKLENEKQSSIVYIPKGVKVENTKEFFSVNTNQTLSEIFDIDAIHKNLVSLHPNMEIVLQVLEKKDHDLLYEWTASEKGQEKIHGFGRIFSTKEGQVTLAYQTKNIGELQRTKEIWIPAIKDVYYKKQ